MKRDARATPFRYDLVIPCHNEARRLRPKAFRAFLAEHPEARLLFVDDGSTDGTSERLRGFDVLRLGHNRGKAEAVRAGVLRCLGRQDPPEAIGFLDADLATPLGEMERLAETLRTAPGLTLAMGSRWVRLGGGVRRAPLRAAAGRAVAAAVRWVTRMPVHDSQCGAKLFRASAARALFGEPFRSRWLFDVELLLRLPGGAARAAEVPLTRWREVGGSRLGAGAALRALLDLARIAWYTRRRNRPEGETP